MSNQAYKKKCMYCDSEIVMDMDKKGKWGAFNLDGEFHQCSKQEKNGNGSKPIIKVNQGPEIVTIETLNARVARLELVIDAIVNTAGPQR